MQNNMRLAYNNIEFVKELNLTIEYSDNFLVWQSLEDDRVLAKAIIDKVSLVEDMIKVDFNLDTALDKKEDSFIYFYCEAKDILFKGNVIDSDNKHMLIEVSDKKYLKEKRLNKRVEFNHLAINLEIKTLKNKKRSLYRSHKVSVSDISSTGMAFFVPQSQSLLFEKSAQVLLAKIENIQLPQEIIGNIVHTTVLKEKFDSNENIKIMIGVKFEKPSKLIKTVIDTLNKESSE